MSRMPETETFLKILSGVEPEDLLNWINSRIYR